MDASPADRGAVVDARLAPAGLTRLLGSYGAGRASVLVLAGVLIGGVCIARVMAPIPQVALGLAFIVAVTLVAAEFGIRSGLRCAAVAIIAMTALAEAVVRIARGLGMQTIAEFVSSPELEAFMREQGVDYAQGFEVGEPVPIAQLGLGRPAARVS